MPVTMQFASVYFDKIPVFVNCIVGVRCIVVCFRYNLVVFLWAGYSGNNDGQQSANL